MGTQILPSSTTRANRITGRWSLCGSMRSPYKKNIDLFHASHAFKSSIYSSISSSIGRFHLTETRRDQALPTVGRKISTFKLRLTTTKKSTDYSTFPFFVSLTLSKRTAYNLGSHAHQVSMGPYWKNSYEPSGHSMTEMISEFEMVTAEDLKRE